MTAGEIKTIINSLPTEAEKNVFVSIWLSSDRGAWNGSNLKLQELAKTGRYATESAVNKLKKAGLIEVVQRGNHGVIFTIPALVSQQEHTAVPTTGRDQPVLRIPDPWPIVHIQDQDDDGPVEPPRSLKEFLVRLDSTEGDVTELTHQFLPSRAFEPINARGFHSFLGILTLDDE